MATRVAPSMTGYLHLGHLYHLLWVYAYAERMGVPVFLRIEDHDRSRARPAYEKALFADLAAFGMVWQGDVLRQQDDLTFYDQQLAILEEAGLVYGCRCSRRELAKLQPVGTSESVYPGRCSDKKLPLEGHTVRFRVTSDRIKFKDGQLVGRSTCLHNSVATLPSEIERGSILISFVVSVMTCGKRSGMWCGAKMCCLVRGVNFNSLPPLGAASCLSASSVVM